MFKPLIFLTQPSQSLIGSFFGRFSMHIFSTSGSVLPGARRRAFSKEIVGSISFHAPPDEVGMIEIGFGICEPCRNQGFGKEALLGMWTWVIDQPGVTTLRYTVSATNTPSMAIINSLGFEHIGQQIDEEDGPEEIFEMSVTEFRSYLVNGFSPNNGS